VFSAASTLLDAFAHIPDPLTLAGTFIADFRAFTAEVRRVRRLHQHKMRRGPANLRACHHESEVLRLNVLSAHFEAVIHGHAEARLVAADALIDAALCLVRNVVHLVLLA
jgi:hypothetical protein